MAESLINSNVGHEKQLVFLNTERLIGVESLDINNTFSLSPTIYAGIGADIVVHIPKQEQAASLSLNSYLINRDYFYELTTGNQLHNVFVVKNSSDLNTVYSLISGYFTSYQCQYSIGNVPTVSTSFTAIYNAGEMQTGQLPSNILTTLQTIALQNNTITGSLLIPYGNSIYLNLPEFNTNRVQAFNVQINSNKIPIYNAGSKFPKKIELLPPINVELGVSFEVGDYQAKQLRQSALNGNVKNISIVVNDYSTNLPVCSYSFNNITLISETYSSSTSNNVLVSQNYSTKLFI